MIQILADVENDGIPFDVKLVSSRKPNAELREAMEDIRLQRNTSGPFATADEAVRSMSEGWADVF